MRNTALNDLRDSPPTPELLAEAIAGGESPAEELERREELTDLMRRLQSLPEPQRAAIVMREMEGLSHEEIAAALGVSGGAARQAIHRARQALRNGAGMLIPLPLMKALLAAGTMGTAEVAAAGAGAGGTVGAGVALKAVTATVLVAGAVGAGVAVQEGHHSGNRSQQPATQSASGGETTSPTAFAPAATTSSDDRSERDRGDDRSGRTSGSGDDRGHGKNEHGEDRGGHRGESGDDHSGGGPGPGGMGGGTEPVDDHGGSSGTGGGRDGQLSHSGSGGSGTSGGGDRSGSGHGGSSGHGGGGSGPSDDSSGGNPGDGPASETGSGSGGPGPSESQELAEPSSGSGGPGDGRTLTEHRDLARIRQRSLSRPIP